MRRNLEIKLLTIIEEGKVDFSKELNTITRYFAGLLKPKVFGITKDSILVYNDVNFDRLCCVLEDNGCVKANELTTFEFFNRSGYCERKFKPAKQ